MAPALSKTLKDGHGIHLSWPLASVGVASVVAACDGGALLSMELLEPQMKLTEDAYAQRMWLNLPSLPFLDPCLPESPLEFPAGSVRLSPFLQAAADQCKTVLVPGPGSLPSHLSLSKNLKDARQVTTAVPGVPDMFVLPVPEHNSRDACVPPGCVPDGGDVPCSPPLTSPPPLFSHGAIQPRCHGALLARPSSVSQGDVAGAPVQPCGGGADCDQPESEALLSRQAGLLCRAGKLQKRLQALLGEHAVLHCSQQLQGLKRWHQTDKPPPCRTPGALSKPRSPWLESWSKPSSSSSSAELQELSRSGCAVLTGLQEALDSEATASSSSDDEPDDNSIHPGSKSLPAGSSSRGSERRWLEQRAEVASRWSWLRLRLAELEGRIKQLGELHQHIRYSKGGVVLAEFQPLTDRQIQQTLLRDTAGLCCTVGALDTDTEPSSPTRLLRNIERQSAQLSQIVNSLMPPLTPLSKQPQPWKGIHKRAWCSGQRGEEAFCLESPKRRRMGPRRRQQADALCVCARTRPLVTYHKPRLFTLHTTSSPPDLGSPTLNLSTLSPSSCDPSVLCSDPSCSSSSPLTSRSSHCRPHPVLSLSFDTPLSHQLQRVLAQGQSSPGHYNRPTHSSTPLHNSHKRRHHARHQRGGVRGVSPTGWAGSAHMPHRRAYQRKRKKRHSHRVMQGDEEDVLYHLCDPEESSEEALEETYTRTSQTHKQALQGLVRRRQGENVYRIDNIVIPMSLAATAKVEKLQYKDILTPSWRAVDSQSLMKKEEVEWEVEVVNDEAFAQRHLASEQREKLRWSSWGTSQRCPRPTRSGSRSSGGGEGVCASGEESCMEGSCSQLDTDEAASWEEWQPLAPWEQRVFPLHGDEEEALCCDEEQQAPSKCSETSASFSTVANDSTAHIFSSATLPSAGQSRNDSLGSY